MKPAELCEDWGLSVAPSYKPTVQVHRSTKDGANGSQRGQYQNENAIRHTPHVDRPPLRLLRV
jgi:hypothetical protein